MTERMHQDEARVMGALEIKLLLLFIAATAALLMTL